MSQTSYNRYFVNAFAGMLGDTGPSYVQTRVNGESINVPAGIGMKEGSTEGTALLPSAATSKLAGITVNSKQRNPGDAQSTLSGTDAFLPKNEMNLLTEGAIFVKPEQAVVVGDATWCRFATSVNDGTLTQKGNFRKDADGVAQVTTGTPGASQNDTVFSIRIEVQDSLGRKIPFDFEYLSDGSMTATEVNNAFRTLMAADTEFSAYITATGTATLILTAAAAGISFTATTEGDGTISWAATTPAAPTAFRVRGARWLKGSDSTSGVALLYFSAAVHNAT